MIFEKSVQLVGRERTHAMSRVGLFHLRFQFMRHKGGKRWSTNWDDDGPRDSHASCYHSRQSDEADEAWRKTTRHARQRLSIGLAGQWICFSNFDLSSCAHDWILAQVCAFTLALVFYTNLYYFRKCFHISQCVVQPVEVSTRHILASCMSAIALHRLTWLKNFVLLQEGLQADKAWVRNCRQWHHQPNKVPRQGQNQVRQQGQNPSASCPVGNM